MALAVYTYPSPLFHLVLLSILSVELLAELNTFEPQTVREELDETIGLQ